MVGDSSSHIITVVSADTVVIVIGCVAIALVLVVANLYQRAGVSHRMFDSKGPRVALYKLRLGTLRFWYIVCLICLDVPSLALCVLHKFQVQPCTGVIL